MKNKEKIMLGLTCFLGGVIAGFLIAPIKEGVYCGNNNGNNNECSSSNIEEIKELINKIKPE